MARGLPVRILVFWLRRGCSGNTLENLVEGGEMSESGQQRSESPLLSDRGATTISDTVVSSIAGMAAQEVEGVHMGGGASRTAGGVLGSLTGSESKTSGISVEVGRTETAIDLKMGIEYNKNILQTVEEVRRRITDRVQSMTGLRIKELNATITDITFPEKEQRRRLGPGSATTESDEVPAEAPATAPEQPAIPEDERDSGVSERDTTQVETHSQAQTETSAETEASEEPRAPEGEATADLPTGDAPTETDAEARRRRRAAERARRRRRDQDG